MTRPRKIGCLPRRVVYDQVECYADRTISDGGTRFRLIHIGDTRTVVDPETLPARLKSAGLDRVDVRTGSRLVFHGYTRKAV